MSLFRAEVGEREASPQSGISKSNIPAKKLASLAYKFLKNHKMPKVWYSGYLIHSGCVVVKGKRNLAGGITKDRESSMPTMTCNYHQASLSHVSTCDKLDDKKLGRSPIHWLEFVEENGRLLFVPATPFKSGTDSCSGNLVSHNSRWKCGCTRQI